MERTGRVERKTAETHVVLSLVIDGKGTAEANTGIGFFDHMLTLLAKHGLFDLKVSAKGDLEVDAHHTVEDVGLVLGQAIKEALGEKISLKRYGSAFVPMDEALAMAALDLSGRPFLFYDVPMTAGRVGEMDTQLVEEFFRALTSSAGITLHIKVFHGSNNHHIIEAIFKAFARALAQAAETDSRIEGVMSTKGLL